MYSLHMFISIRLHKTLIHVCILGIHMFHHPLGIKFNKDLYRNQMCTYKTHRSTQCEMILVLSIKLYCGKYVFPVCDEIQARK